MEAFIRAGESGKSRDLRPVAAAIAFASAAAVGPWPASPVPKKGCPGRFTIWTLTVSGTELKRRIGKAGDPMSVKCNLLMQRPTDRL
jgi:hypothetical protein